MEQKAKEDTTQNHAVCEHTQTRATPTCTEKKQKVRGTGTHGASARVSEVPFGSTCTIYAKMITDVSLKLIPKHRSATNYEYYGFLLNPKTLIKSA